MEQNTQIIKKFAWLPTKVNILDDNRSRQVIIWFSNYFEKQSFVAIKNFEWGWVTNIKYLDQINLHIHM